MHDLAKDRAPLESVGKNNNDILHEKKKSVCWCGIMETYKGGLTNDRPKKEGGDIVFYFAIPGAPL